MSFVSYNANRDGEKTVDCTVRAIATVLDQSWDETYLGLCMQGYIMASMPSGNEVWGAYLHNKGWRRGMVEDACPECFTVRDFCERFPKGKFLNIYVSAYVDVPRGCCWTVGVRNISDIPVNVQNANLIVDRVA